MAWKAPRKGGLPPFVAAGGCALASLLALSGSAEASVQLADGFVYLPNESGEAGCLPQGGDGPLQDVVESALTEVDLDPTFAVVLTARVLTCASIYYTAISNDVTGIGYQRSDPEETFDRSPESSLEGIVFLNDLPYWVENPEEFRSAFLHEIGHRFLARVHADVNGEDVDLTGRQGGHWSYFLDTDGSPLEGNDFSDDDTPVATAPQFPARYSALDLYLMGALDPSEVPSFRLLTPGEPLGRDCTGRTIGRASPPQSCEPLAVPGSWTPLSIEDVISAEGPRSPARGEARSAFSIAFLILDAGGAGFDVDACSSLALDVDALIEHFGNATEGRLSLTNAVTARTACEDLIFSLPPPSGCSLAPRGPHFSGEMVRFWGALSVLLLLGARRITRSRARAPRTQR